MQENPVKKQPLTMLAILVLFDATGSVDAAEFYDQADVIRYEAVTSINHTRQIVPGCMTDRPDTIHLVELLRWDLGASNCVKVVSDKKITGYRVFYQWDNQLFSQVTHELPGQTIPVHVRID